MNNRNFTWKSESEHSPHEEARATALAKRWSELRAQEENRSWQRQAEIEEGNCYEPDLEYCDTCNGDGELGLDGPRKSNGDLLRYEWQVGIQCPASNCEDGRDMSQVRDYERQQREQQAEHDLEVELVEDKLEQLGARMMRPYEHWNEDESYVEYMECGRFGHEA